MYLSSALQSQNILNTPRSLMFVVFMLFGYLPYRRDAIDTNVNCQKRMGNGNGNEIKFEVPAGLL